MKIGSVRAVPQARYFEVETPRGHLRVPYSRVVPRPTGKDRVARVLVENQPGLEGFHFFLSKGRVGWVSIDSVLKEHLDPAHTADLLASQLAAEARKRLAKVPLFHADVCRQLAVSAEQLNSLVEPGKGHRSLRQLLFLVSVLGCQVELRLSNSARRARKTGRFSNGSSIRRKRAGSAGLRRRAARR